MFKKEAKPQQSEGDTFVIEMTYDLKTNNFNLKAPGVPTVMLYGLLQMGLSVCIQKQAENQIMARITAAAANSKIKVAGANEIPSGKA